MFARDFIIRDVTNANNVFFGVIGATDRVGIGTSTPTQKLTVVGTIESTTGGVKYPDGNTQTVAYLGSSQTVTAGNVSSGVFGYPSAVSNYSFPNQLGVGMPTAAGLTAMLYVSSTAATTPFRVDDEVSDTTPFIIDTAGNVGIGTTGPISHFMSRSQPHRIMVLLQ